MWTDAAHRRIEQAPGRMLDGVETGHCGVDGGADAQRVLRGDVQAGIGDGLAGGSHREVGEAGRAAQPLGVEDGGRVKAPYLAGDPGG